MRAYSMDLRERLLLDSDAGMKAADVAAKYRVSGSWVRLLKQRRRETGEVAPRGQRHGRRCMLEPHASHSTNARVRSRSAGKGMSQEVATPTLRPIMYDRTECWVSSSALKGDAAVRRCDRWLYERFSCAKPRCPS